MKTFKNEIHRFFAFVLAFAMAVRIFGSTTAFAAETQDSDLITEVNETVTPRVTSVLFKSTGDYVTGNFYLGQFTVKKPPLSINTTRMLTIAYSYEDRYHNHQATLEFKSDVHTTAIHLDDAISGSDSVLIYYGVPYTVTIIPGCTADYMASVSVYY